MNTIPPHPDPHGNHYGDEETQGVEACIARELSRMLDITPSAECDQPPVPYIRRHLAEHAAAGHVLNDAVIPPALVPYLDPVRLRIGAAAHKGHTWPTLSTLRRVTHLWDFAHPPHNAANLSMQAALDAAILPYSGGLMPIRWAHGTVSNHEILTRAGMPIRVLAAIAPIDERSVVIIGDHDGVVQVWDLNAGSPVGQPLNYHTSQITAIATITLPDQRPIALIGDHDGAVYVWDLAAVPPSGNYLCMHPGRVTAIAQKNLPDGRVMAAIGYYNGTALAYDVISGAPIGEPLHGVGHVTTVAITVLSDGKPVVLTGGRGETVHIWKPESAAPTLEAPTGHTGFLFSVAAVTLADGRPAGVAVRDGTVQVWDLNTNIVIGDLSLNQARFASEAVAVTVLPDGQPAAVIGTGDGPVRVWNLSTATPYGELLTGHTGRVNSIFSIGLAGKQHVAVTGSDDGTVRVWNLHALEGEARKVNSVSAAAVATTTLPDGRHVAVTVSRGDGEVRRWDLATGMPVGEAITKGASAVDIVAVTDGEPVAVTGSRDGTVRVWNLSTGTLIGKPFIGHAGRVTVVAATSLVSGEPVAVTGSRDGTVRVWNLSTGTLIGKPITDHAGGVTALAVASLPNGQPVAVVGDVNGVVRIWNLATGKRVGEAAPALSGGVTAVAAIALPGDQLIALSASGVDGTLQRWDLLSGEPLGDPFSDDTGYVIAMAATTLLPKGPSLAVIANGLDNTVRIWDLAIGEPVGGPIPVISTRAIAIHRDTASCVMVGEGIAVGDLNRFRTR